jgi:hypothetical protein
MPLFDAWLVADELAWCEHTRHFRAQWPGAMAGEADDELGETRYWCAHDRRRCAICATTGALENDKEGPEKANRQLPGASAAKASRPRVGVRAPMRSRSDA